MTDVTFYANEMKAKVKMTMIKFGTGGWRAIIGQDFIMDNIVLLSQAIATDIKKEHSEEKGIVIGYDRRFLSDKAAKWIAEVMAANRVKVFFIDRIAPTPLIMYTVKRLGSKYGVAVTASHNLADYNGIKVFTQGGCDADQKTTDRFENILATMSLKDVQTIPFEEGIENGTIITIDPFNDYIDTILGMIDVEAIRKRRLKILLDPMFGVSKTCLQTVLVTTRCEVDTIHDRHDTLFGGRLPSPSAETLDRLRSIVLEQGYDLGIGTDGDADRLGIIDDKGAFIHPNDILVLLYYYLVKYKGWKGGVVRNVATTHLLDRIARDFGEECYEVPVGFKHISAKMEEKNALIGGESSGGLTIRGHIRGKDGIFAASLLVEMISITGKRISELLKEIHDTYGTLSMVEKNFTLTRLSKARLMHILFEERKIPDFGVPVKKVSYEDGVKVYFENDGWIIARFSGTEPLMRIYAEMQDRQEADRISEVTRVFLGI